jgi:tRNA pseudouridine32 synthase/23S rRNA pseudouridine746 synthase
VLSNDFNSLPQADSTGQVYRVVVDEDGTSPDLCLSQSSALSQSRIKFAMTCGAVWMTRGKSTQRLRRASRALRCGDLLHLYYNAQVLDSTPPAAQLVADAGEFSVWDKPGQMWSQGSKWGDHWSITRYAETHLQPQRNGFVVHRLDRAASGLILVAHGKRAAAALSALFRNRRISKCYRVAVTGVVGEVGKVVVMQDPIDGRGARSKLKVLRTDAAQNCSILDVWIETGRKHQIRKHLSALGHPVVGDRLYGGATSGDLQLRAYCLEFLCPFTDETRKFELATNRITLSQHS